MNAHGTFVSSTSVYLAVARAENQTGPFAWTGLVAGVIGDAAVIFPIAGPPLSAQFQVPQVSMPQSSSNPPAVAKESISAEQITRFLRRREIQEKAKKARLRAKLSAIIAKLPKSDPWLDDKYDLAF
jgi:hypothetical protein